MHSFRLRRLAVTATLAVALTACGGGGDDDAVDAVDGSSSTTTEPSGSAEGPGDDGDGTGAETDDTTADTAPGGTDPGSSGGQTTTTAAGGGGGVGGGGSAATAATPIAPRSGTYTYQRKVQSPEGNQDDTTDVLVERVSGDDTAAKLRVTLESPQGQLVNDMSVGPDGATVHKSVIQSAMGQIDCDWTPDWALNGPFQVGSTWTVASKCSDTVGTLKVDITLSGTGKVVGTEVIEVAGRSVTAWVVESKMVTDIVIESPTVSGTQHTESTSKNWIDPSLGMNVKTVSDDVNSGDFASGNSHSETTLIGTELS